MANVNIVVDIQNGQVVVDTTGPDLKSVLKAAGGNARVKKNTGVSWEAASGVGFNIGFVTLEEANDSKWPKPILPFEDGPDTDGEKNTGDDDSDVFPQFTDCTYFKAKTKNNTGEFILIKYTIRAWNNDTEAELDPMIIIEK